MLSVRSQISKSVYNHTAKFNMTLSKPHQRNLREIVLGNFLGGTTHLKTIGEVVSSDVTPRKNIERLSRTLGKLNADKLTQIHINGIASPFKEEPILILSDGGDFQKPYAKAMEKVSQCVDGSNDHKIGWGYPTFAGVAYGLESKRQMPLFQRLWSKEEDGFKSEWDEHQKAYRLLEPVLHNNTYDRIVVEDRGGDDEKRFVWFRKEMGFGFLTRILAGNKSRHLKPMEKKKLGASISVKALAQMLRKQTGNEKIYFNKKLKKELASKVAFQEVRLPDHDDMPLYLVLVYTDGYEEPMALLTDIAVKDFEKAWKVYFWYQKRWEVENFFRCTKQNFGAEKFLVRSLKKIKALAFIMVLVHSLMLKLREAALHVLQIFWNGFQNFCKRDQRNDETPLDLLAYIRKLFSEELPLGIYRFYSWKTYKYRFYKPKNQPSLFYNRKKW